MKPKLVFLVLLSYVAPALAHPGVGIVQDSRGNVYFTDLKQVWKITPDGKQSVAVSKVHTHELYVDRDDNIYGEHLWYEGGTKTWRHRVWQLKPDGTVVDIIPSTEGFRTEYSFVRDRQGVMFWVDHDETNVIKRMPKDGKPMTHYSGDLRQVSRMTATADGTIFLMDSGDLRRVATDGKISTVVARLSGQENPPENVSDVNYHMGLWTDNDGSVYVAVAAEQLVVRVTEEGEVSVIAQTRDPWSPSGGMIDMDGNLWLLEFDTNDTARVRRIDKDGRDTDKVFIGESPR